MGYYNVLGCSSCGSVDLNIKILNKCKYSHVFTNCSRIKLIIHLGRKKLISELSPSSITMCGKQCFDSQAAAEDVEFTFNSKLTLQTAFTLRSLTDIIIIFMG